MTVLALIPLCSLLFTLTNGLHGFVWDKVELDRSGPFVVLEIMRGPWYWVHAVYSYALVLCGTSLRAYKIVRSSRLYHPQDVALLSGVLLSSGASLLYVVGISPVHNLNPGVLVFPVTGALFALGLFRFRFLDLSREQDRRLHRPARRAHRDGPPGARRRPQPGRGQHPGPRARTGARSWCLRPLANRPDHPPICRRCAAPGNLPWERLYAPLRRDPLAAGGRRDNLVRVNAALSLMLGYGEGDLRGRSFHQLTHPADRTARSEPCREIADGQRDRYQAERRMLKRDGTVIWARFSASAIRSTHPGQELAVVMVEDVTDRNVLKRFAGVLVRLEVKGSRF